MLDSGKHWNDSFPLNTFVSSACDDGKFGLNCSNTCSSFCFNDTVCDRVTGHCDEGCDPGYTNLHCNAGKFRRLYHASFLVWNTIVWNTLIGILKSDI